MRLGRCTVSAMLGTLMLSAGVPLAGSAQSSMAAARQGAAGKKLAPGLLRPARLAVRDVTLANALTRLYDTSGVPISFSPSLLPRQRSVSCECKSMTVSRALDQLLSRTGLQYREIDGHVLLYRVVKPDIVQPRFDLVELHYASFEAVQPRHAPFDFFELPVVIQEGTVTGSVRDAQTRRPLSGVQVHVPGSGLGTLTNAAGRYTLTNVPGGQVTIRAQMIGYAAGDTTISVSAGGTVTADFELREEALALNEIVVTGTAGGTQRRAIGNVVDRIAAAAALELAPTRDVQQLMAFKSPGMSILPAQADVGSGSAIRIRGSSSIGLSSEPLVYIDGVRMNSGFGGPTNAGGRNNSRLNDINPNDIESIEVIKGPAAATLYGTEASAGVIQIITKRGVEGEPSFDFVVGQGATWFPNPEENLPVLYGLDEAGNLISVNLYEHEAENGLGPIFQTGHLQNYSASVTGGTSAVRYFASASWDDRTGFVDYNWFEGLGTRANLSVIPRDNLTFSLNTSYHRSTNRKWQGGADDIFKQVLWGSPEKLDTRTRGFLRRTPEAIRDQTEALSAINRVITAFTVEHQPTSWMTQRLNVGFDVTHETNSELVRRSPEGAAGFFQSNSLGVKVIDAHEHEVLTVDYAATVSVPVTDDISSVTSVGAQYFRRSTESQVTEGRTFPAPGFESISAAAQTEASEDFLENATIGSYVQQQFGWRDRLFLTGAVRGDDNSAFGTNFDAAIYPKLSATWVVHEEPFWNIDALNRLRLRSAWGVAGRQPDAFDASRLYDAVTGPGDEAGLSPSSYGNPDLKPERSEELEVGFDAAFLNDRIDLAYTYYSKTTKDAIIPVPLEASRGFPGEQILNVGQLSNWGHEISLSARVVDRPGKMWEVGLKSAFLRDRVDDLGPAEFIFFSDSRGAGEHRVGYPLEGIFFIRVLSADLLPDGTTSNEMCDGGTGPDGHRPGGPPVPCDQAPKVYWGRGGNPTWEASVWTTFTLGNLRLYARADGRGGHMFMDADPPVAHTSFRNSSLSNLDNNPIFQAYRKLGRQPLGFTNAGFIRLRDVAATYTLPTEWVERFGGSNASITVSGRNLALLWQEQEHVKLSDGSIIPDPKVLDPERRFSGGQGNFVEALVPPLPVFMTTVRLSF